MKFNLTVEHDDQKKTGSGKPAASNKKSAASSPRSAPSSPQQSPVTGNAQTASSNKPRPKAPITGKPEVQATGTVLASRAKPSSSSGLTSPKPSAQKKNKTGQSRGKPASTGGFAKAKTPTKTGNQTGTGPTSGQLSRAGAKANTNATPKVTSSQGKSAISRSAMPNGGTRSKSASSGISSGGKKSKPTSSGKTLPNTAQGSMAKAAQTPGNAMSGQKKQPKALASQPSLPQDQAQGGPLLGTRSPVGTDPNSPSDPTLKPVGSLLPKTPQKEPPPTAATANARARQSNVLKTRQNRELKGETDGAPRDIDAGAGIFWPMIGPL